MNATRIFRAAEAASVPRKATVNRYKARKPWPPDFSKLDTKYQFRLERRYRRRSKLKWTRPGWIKGVKLAQWGICLCKYLFLDLNLAPRFKSAHRSVSYLWVWSNVHGVGKCWPSLRRRQCQI